jgi:4-diphosphocytidyl-2-C-methyl-D-erythritol kinase
MTSRAGMKILSPAKINLFLQVTGKRADGYHNLYSLMCCVDLYDTLRFRFGGHHLEIKSNHPRLPLDETNLAHRAARLFFNALKIDDGLTVSIEKVIPVAGGLGGGSSNAAAVLEGLNLHYGQPLSRDRLMALGLSIGADVPFFLFRKPAFARGVGEKLQAYQWPLPYHVVLVCPPIQVSTAEVFRNLNLGLTKCKKKFTKTPLRKEKFDAALHLCNDLESITVSQHPVVEAARNQLLTHGAAGALMSGSGPSVFGLFSDSDTAGRARHILDKDARWDAYLADIIDETHHAGH